MSKCHGSNDPMGSTCLNAFSYCYSPVKRSTTISIDRRRNRGTAPGPTPAKCQIWPSEPMHYPPHWSFPSPPQATTSTLRADSSHSVSGTGANIFTECGSKAPTLKLSLEKENEEQSLWLPTYLSWVVSHTFAKSMSQGASLVAQRVKNPPTKQETRVQSLSQEDPLKKGIATYSSILAWQIPWTKESGGL